MNDVVVLWLVQHPYRQGEHTDIKLQRLKKDNVALKAFPGYLSDYLRYRLLLQYFHELAFIRQVKP